MCKPAGLLRGLASWLSLQATAVRQWRATWGCLGSARVCSCEQRGRAPWMFPLQPSESSLMEKEHVAGRTHGL